MTRVEAKDIMTFPWEKDTDEKQEETAEDIEKVMEEMKQIEKKLNGGNNL